MKTYVLTISQTFQGKHPKKGQPTNFFDKILSGEKIHTLRGNYYYWKRIVDKVNSGEGYLSVRAWFDRPYRSKQIELFDFTKLGIQKYEFIEHENNGVIYCKWVIDGVQKFLPTNILAKNDGLSCEDFNAWFPEAPNQSEPMAIIHFTDFRY